MPSWASLRIPRNPFCRFLFLLIWFFVMACAFAMHMPLRPPLVCHCVHWMPCLALNPPFHNSKISLLKTGCIKNISSKWNFLTILVMKLRGSEKRYACLRSNSEVFYLTKVWMCMHRFFLKKKKFFSSMWTYERKKHLNGFFDSI